MSLGLEAAEKVSLMSAADWSLPVTTFTLIGAKLAFSPGTSLQVRDMLWELLDISGDFRPAGLISVLTSYSTSGLIPALTQGLNYSVIYLPHSRYHPELLFQCWALAHVEA